MGLTKGALYSVLRRSFRVVISLYYQGSAVYCPCCGRSARRFLSYGVIPRPNVRCPFCDALERHRLISVYIRERHLLTPPMAVLHLAPETAMRPVFQNRPGILYVTADIESPIAGMLADVTALPFLDNAFDAILCSHVLEHVLDDRKAMCEIWRILKPSGWALLHVPIDRNRAVTFEDPSITSPQERLRVFGQWDHVRIYGRDYIDRLLETGFSVNADKFSQSVSVEEAERYRIPRDEDIYLCRKNKEGATF